MKKRADKLKKGSKIWVPVVAGIYNSSDPLCLVRACVTSTQIKNKLVTVRTREHKPFSLPVTLRVELAK